MLVKLDHFPKDRGENETYLKPPPGSASMNLLRVVMTFGYFGNIIWPMELPEKTLTGWGGSFTWRVRVFSWCFWWFQHHHEGWFIVIHVFLWCLNVLSKFNALTFFWCPYWWSSTQKETITFILVAELPCPAPRTGQGPEQARGQCSYQFIFDAQKLFLFFVSCSLSLSSFTHGGAFENQRAPNPHSNDLLTGPALLWGGMDLGWLQVVMWLFESGLDTVLWCAVWG